LILPLASVATHIRGTSWWGFETGKAGLFCDQPHDYDWHLQKMTDLGFNCIRLPFCSDYLRGDMKGMDDFMKATQNYNLTIVLDFHRLNNQQQSPKPYDDSHPFQMFLDDWVFIIDRYKDYSRLVGIDLFNEYQSNDYGEWNSLATQAINYIEARFPGRFYYFVGCYTWGTDCQFVDVPVPFEDTRVFYTIHSYTWTHQEPMEHRWDACFGDSSHKIVVGEFGYMTSIPEQVAWFQRFIRYLKSRGNLDGMFWSWNAGSSDTTGVLEDDCSTINYGVMQELWNYWS
jgi:endoglucanase